MQRLTARRRGRALASLITVAGLGIGAAAAVAGPAQSADPTGDCAVAFPEADLAAGQDVTGLTVTHGTTPEGFTGEVLGVLDDGIAPDIDMIMVRLDSPEIERVGIWQGMSGSPVYAEDGRLIGAVSYGLAMGPSPVAGVTPFEKMDDYLADTASTVEVGPRRGAHDRGALRRLGGEGPSGLRPAADADGRRRRRRGRARPSGPPACRPLVAAAVDVRRRPRLVRCGRGGRHRGGRQPRRVHDLG